MRESRESWILDSTRGLWTPDTGFRILLSLELGFWIPTFSGIPKSLSCIPDSKAQDSGFSYMGRGIFWIGDCQTLKSFQILVLSTKLDRPLFIEIWFPWYTLRERILDPL